MKFALDLAPALADGIFKDDWKIRVNSLQLLGELLFLVGDVKTSGAGAEGDDENDFEAVNLGASKILGNIKAYLGIELTEEILSALYMARYDIAVSVRQCALPIWKAIVSNTPRTLVEIMPTLIRTVVDKLSSESEDLRIIAGRSIGELVTKLGDKVLPAIVSPLQSGLESASESTRLGVCLGLCEVLHSCSKKQAEEYIDSIISAVKLALCDESAEVSEQAARAFMILYKTVGVTAIDEIIPVLLKSLSSADQEESEEDTSSYAMRGLKEIVALKPREMLEYLLPMFLVSPIQSVSAQALSSVLEVSGNYVHFHFNSLIHSIVQELYMIEDNLQKPAVNEESEKQRLDGLKKVIRTIVSVTTASGIHQLILEVGKQIEHETSLKRRKWGCFIAEQLFASCKNTSYDDYIPILLKFILARITDNDQQILLSLRDCLQSMATNVPLEKFCNHAEFIKNCLTSNVSSARHRTDLLLANSKNGQFILPYFSLPKSLDPFLAIFLYVLVNGNPPAREIAADMIGELANLTEFEVLKPTLIKTVGPLIRVVGERHPSSLKSVILNVRCFPSFRFAARISSHLISL
jgi:hypothetical protein